MDRRGTLSIGGFRIGLDRCGVLWQSWNVMVCSEADWCGEVLRVLAVEVR